MARNYEPIIREELRKIASRQAQAVRSNIKSKKPGESFDVWLRTFAATTIDQTREALEPLTSLCVENLVAIARVHDREAVRLDSNFVPTYLDTYAQRQSMLFVAANSPELIIDEVERLYREVDSSAEQIVRRLVEQVLGINL